MVSLRAYSSDLLSLQHTSSSWSRSMTCRASHVTATRVTTHIAHKNPVKSKRISTRLLRISRHLNKNLLPLSHSTAVHLCQQVHNIQWYKLMLYKLYPRQNVQESCQLFFLISLLSLVGYFTWFYDLKS